MSRLISLKRPARRVLDRLDYERSRRRLGRSTRSITAMLRVRNEEQFVRAAVLSIIDVVDEVVIVDNASTDATPAVLGALAAEHPELVRVHSYPHELYRVGAEHALAARHGDAGDPRKLSTYYNWCLARCPGPFVLKWDGDMVATAPARELLAGWRARRATTAWFRGTNVYPDLAHRLGGTTGAAADRVDDASLPPPNMLDDLTFTVSEPRLFPHATSTYVDGRSWERLTGPFVDGPDAPRHTYHEPRSCYVHLKYCKTDPHANQSAEYAAALREQVRGGDPLSADERAALERWVPRGT